MNYEDVWFRKNDRAVDGDSDHELLGLIERAQAGDEEAMAGVMVSMTDRRGGLTWKFRGNSCHSAGSRDDAWEATGYLSVGWVDSSMALAVAAFDCSRRSGVARRLYMDTRYILRMPSRRHDAAIGVWDGTDGELQFSGQTASIDSDVAATGEAWLRAALWADARGRETDERFAVVVDAIVMVWLRDVSVAKAAAEVGLAFDTLRFYVKRSRAALATDEIRQQLAG